jgi:hypothetical protein
MDILYTFKCKRFRNTRQTVTFVKLFLEPPVVTTSSGCHNINFSKTSRCVENSERFRRSRPISIPVRSAKLGPCQLLRASLRLYTWFWLWKMATPLVTGGTQYTNLVFRAECWRVCGSLPWKPPTCLRCCAAAGKHETHLPLTCGLTGEIRPR